MSAAHDGGSAFPILAEQANDGWASCGMTMRDYFAAKALQGMLANNEISGPYTDYARRSFVVADAMLEARK